MEKSLQRIGSALLDVNLQPADVRQVNVLLSLRPAAERRMLAGLLHTIDAIARFPGAAGLQSTDPGSVVRVLAERGPAPLRRGLAGLRSLCALAYYGCADNWPAIGYDGPWLGRFDVPVYSLPEPRSTAVAGTLRAQVCIVGAGAGGCAAAARLAANGVDVVVLEAGQHTVTSDYNQREFDMLPLLYADAGLRANADQSISILQGAGVGGSTLHNTGLVVPPPAAILERWRVEHGLAWSESLIEAAIRQATSALRAVDIPEFRINANNQKLRAGAGGLGWRHFIAQHNRTECSGCGYCMLGCAYNRKTNAAAAFLAPATAQGARLVAGATVRRIRREGAGWLVSAETGAGALRVRADVLLMAAGALETPALLLNNGIGNDQVGRHLRLHPAIMVAARFPEVIEAWRGVPQSVIVNHFAAFEHDGRGGFLLLPNAANAPGLLAAGVCAMDRAHRELMSGYDRLASAVVLLHDEGTGRVTVNRSGRPSARYWLEAQDRMQLEHGAVQLGRVYFSAGAERVYSHGGVAEDETALKRGRITRYRQPISSVHPQGSCRLGSHANSSALKANGEVRGARGMFVGDASLFPTSIGVPPQVAIMAFASLIAEEITMRVVTR